MFLSKNNHTLLELLKMIFHIPQTYHFPEIKVVLEKREQTNTNTKLRKLIDIGKCNVSNTSLMPPSIGLSVTAFG